MKVRKTELLALLNLCSYGLDNTDSTDVIFDNNLLFTYNENVYISVDFKSPFSCKVSADYFTKIVKTASDEFDIILKNDNMVLTFEDKSKAEIITNDLQNTFKSDIPKTFKTLPANFLQAIKQTLFTCNRDISMSSFTCLHLDKEYITSCDNARITRMNFTTPIEDAFLFRCFEAQKLLSSKFEPVGYAITDNFIHFKNQAGFVFSCIRPTFDALDLSPFFGKTGEDITFPETMADSIKRAAVFATDDLNTQSINVVINKNKIKMNSHNNYGKFTSNLIADYDKAEIKFSINPTFFLDVLNVFDGASITEDKIYFSNKDLTHIISLT